MGVSGSKHKLVPSNLPPAKPSTNEGAPVESAPAPAPAVPVEEAPAAPVEASAPPHPSDTPEMKEWKGLFSEFIKEMEKDIDPLLVPSEEDKPFTEHGIEITKEDLNNYVNGVGDFSKYFVGDIEDTSDLNYITLREKLKKKELTDPTEKKTLLETIIKKYKVALHHKYLEEAFKYIENKSSNKIGGDETDYSGSDVDNDYSDSSAQISAESESNTESESDSEDQNGGNALANIATHVAANAASTAINNAAPPGPAGDLAKGLATGALKDPNALLKNPQGVLTHVAADAAQDAINKNAPPGLAGDLVKGVATGALKDPNALLKNPQGVLTHVAANTAQDAINKNAPPGLAGDLAKGVANGALNDPDALLKNPKGVLGDAAIGAVNNLLNDTPALIEIMDKNAPELLSVYKNGVIDETVPVDALAKTLQDKLMSYQSGSEKVQTGGKKMKKNKKQQINISINVGNTNIIDTESSSSSESDSSSSSDNKSDNELNYKYVVNNVKRKKRKHVS